MPKLSPARLLACSFLFAATLHAQTHRVDAPEKVTRSVAVYEWTGDLAKPTAARLIPVSLFIEGQFQDGGTYYARPVPLALVDGNIYSLEKAGVPQGTITLDFARHLQTATSGSDNTIDLGWFGYGTYATMPVARKAPALHASSTVPSIASSKDKDTDRPTFANKKTDTSKSTSKPDNTTTSVTPPSSEPEDPDRPHFSKPPATPPGQTPSSDPSSTTTTAKPATKTDEKSNTNPTIEKDPDNDKDRPTLRHRDPKQAEADRKARDRSGVTATGSLNDDPDRPNMRRGKTAGIGGAPSPQLSGIPADLHQAAAVSDPTNREPHPFARDWATPTERAEILSKLQAIAQTQLANYAATNGTELAPAPQPKTGTLSKSGVRSSVHATHTPPRTLVVSAPLTDEQLTGYTLSYGGLPTFVYTASSTAPSASALSNPTRYVTVVAQQLPSGEIQLALSSVTDAAHLDRTPWFRLVDAVDPDAEHRASLLFELRGHTSRQFALYRILSARAEQIFITHPSD